MARGFLHLILAYAVLLSACAGLPQGELTLEEALVSDRAVSIPMRLNDQGLIVLEDIKVQGKPLNMLLDTGATQSAILRSAEKRFGFKFSSGQDSLVHGMMQSQFQRVVSVPKIDMGPLEFTEKSMIILDDTEAKPSLANSYDGIIGMDILSEFQLYIPRSAERLVLIKNSSPVTISAVWPRIDLTNNPFRSEDRGLHFMDIRVAGQNKTALLDTGASFSAMNWVAANYPQARQMRKRLRRDWEYRGAISEFRPTAKLKLGNFRSGQVFWTDKDFLLVDFESLDVLGISEQPFIIAGMNLFEDTSLFIDFDRDFLALDSAKLAARY